MSTFHKLTIQQIIKETPDAVSILFEIPADLKEQFSFVAKARGGVFRAQ